MTQVANYTVEDGDGLSVLSEITSIFGAVRDDNSGPSPPANSVAFMRWRDTSVSPPRLMVRNAANTAWVSMQEDLSATTVSTITNLNTLQTQGEYFADSGATGSPNSEPIIAKHYAADVTTRAVQEVFGLTSGRRWLRRETAGAWGSWVEIPGGAGITVAMLAAAAVRLASEGYASPVDTEVPTTLWVDGAIPNKLNASGSAPLYACRAWANFNGSGGVALRAFGNVSSLIRNGTGDYTINFVTAMPDANYAVFVTAGRGASASAGRIGLAPHGAAPTASSIRLIVSDVAGVPQDSDFVSIAIFR